MPVASVSRATSMAKPSKTFVKRRSDSPQGLRPGGRGARSTRFGNGERGLRSGMPSCRRRGASGRTFDKARGHRPGAPDTDRHSPPEDASRSAQPTREAPVRTIDSQGPHPARRRPAIRSPPAPSGYPLRIRMNPLTWSGPACSGLQGVLEELQIRTPKMGGHNQRRAAPPCWGSLIR